MKDLYTARAFKLNPMDLNAIAIDLDYGTGWTHNGSTSFPGCSLLWRKDPGRSWSRGSQKINYLRGVGKVSYYMLPLPHLTLRSQGVSVLYNQP